MKISLHAKISEGRISLEPYQRMRLLSWLEKNPAGEYKLVVDTEKGNKTKNALGFYWGGILPALIAQNKQLVHQGEIKNNPLLLSDLLRNHKIKRSEVEALHRDILITFRPDIATDLKTGKKYRIGQEMKNYDNGDLYQLTDEIIAWGEEQGYEFPSSEDYLEMVNKL